ncbi:hypothetical protein HYDPIDRAFT_166913 [Hydnomerulius pinastri MD-312]|nr:hypothetical protein HYDPIDRAFT_166913 [Hydnomerulius pinastri MD-312]
MRSLLLPFVLLSLGLAASAGPNLSPWTLHERRSNIPLGWSHSRKQDPSAAIPLRIALAQSNIEDIEEYLYDVSHPNSPNYGKHWTAGQVAAKFAPSQESVDAVRDWLLDSGIEAHRVKVSPSKGWLEFQSTVQEAEDLLHTSYHVYGHETGAEHVACEGYHLPEHLAPHIDFVTPSVHFDAKLSKRGDTAFRPIGKPGSGNGPKTTGTVTNWIDQLEDCDNHITPICLRALYGLIYEPLSADKNSYGIVEYTPQTYIQSDLDLFAKNFSTGLEGVSPKMVSVDGGVLVTDNQGFDTNGEANLDLEYGMTLVTSKQNVTLYQVGDKVEGASFNNFLDALDGTYCSFEGGDDRYQDAPYPDPSSNGYQGHDCGTTTPTNVISTSYGYNEADLTPAYTARQCAEYAKLGLMGVTVVYSSGDYGVAGSWGECLNPDGSQSLDGTIFNPSFPSTCPFVTSIGATQVSPGKTVYDSEDACEQVIYSGGGFSNYFAVPDYQKNAVSSYLKDFPPAYPGNIWNSTGTSRGYPDISANGANYVIAVDGEFSLIYGTSASAPVVGAILTMINDARITANKKPIGFINPMIYSSNFSDAFNDVTNGTNQGCGTDGFNATKGWDPVTGLGTPNFPKLLAKWLTMP